MVIGLGRAPFELLTQTFKIFEKATELLGRVGNIGFLALKCRVVVEQSLSNCDAKRYDTDCASSDGEWVCHVGALGAIHVQGIYRG
jgi:hypothetical protein